VIYSLLVPLLISWFQPQSVEAFEQDFPPSKLAESTEAVCPCTLTQGNTVVPFPLFSNAQTALGSEQWAVKQWAVNSEQLAVGSWQSISGQSVSLQYPLND
jgi:hypothetical protein